MRHTSIRRRELLRQTGAWGLGSATLLATGSAFAAVFMDIGQAQKLLLPQAQDFQPRAITLDAAGLATIASQSETRLPRNFAPHVWEAFSDGQSIGWIVADRVIGKYDWIDFAAGFSADGAIAGVEVMAYRESHGAEIRQGAWRRQFIGRTGPRSLRFGDDIRNISGATLSCQHLTEGIQRLSAMVGLMKGHR